QIRRWSIAALPRNDLNAPIGRTVDRGPRPVVALYPKGFRARIVERCSGLVLTYFDAFSVKELERGTGDKRAGRNGTVGDHDIGTSSRDIYGVGLERAAALDKRSVPHKRSNAALHDDRA